MLESVMPYKNDRKISHLARIQRHNFTEAEAKLWSHLRAHRLEGIHFRRQYVIGKYIVDFCAPRYKLIIEVDGSQHLDRQASDDERSAFLKSKGFRIIRFWNHDIMNNLESVLISIQYALYAREKK